MDETKLQTFMGKLVNDMGGAAMLASVVLGEHWGCTARWLTVRP